MSRREIIVFVCSMFLLGLGEGPVQAGAQAKSECFFPAQPGDTLIVQNDYGRVQVQASESLQVEARFRKNVAAQDRRDPFEVVCQKSGDKIFVYSFFSGSPGESVNLDVQVPKFLHVVIWGANPEIELRGLQGFVRVQTFTGSITAEDLTSSVSILSDRGDITYRANVQPQGDTRIESTSGYIRCELAGNLNLRGWIRAGGALSWDKEAELQGTSFEKQMGSFGPLLYAGSLKGSVHVYLKEGAKVPAAPPPKPAEARRTDVKNEDALQIPERSPEISRAPEPKSPKPNPRPVTPKQQTETSARSAQPTALPGAYSVKVNVDSVYLNLSVRDRASNRSVTGLQKSDFQVYEDGALQQVEQFLPTEAAFDLLLLLDVSGSTRSFLHLEKEASIDFTRQIKANDRMAIATFNSSVELVQDFTGDRAEAARAINRIQSGGGTAFYDALETCIHIFMRGIEGRKAIVVFTDGVDNQLEGKNSEGSRITFGQLYRSIQEVDTIIYTIFLDTEGRTPMSGNPGGSSGGVIDVLGDIIRGRPMPRRYPAPSPGPRYPNPRGRGNSAIYDEAREQLLTIADQTGGRMYSPQRIEDLNRVYSEIADDLRVQYQLGYNSTNRAQDGKWREIHVQVPSHPEAAVRTRKGYYARQFRGQAP